MCAFGPRRTVLFAPIHRGDDVVDPHSGRLLDLAAAQTPKTMSLVNANLSTLQKVGDDMAAGMTDVKRILGEVEAGVAKLTVILANMEAGSYDVPEITRTTRIGIQEIREGVARINTVVTSIRENALVRSNLPPEPAGQTIDAGLRE